MSNYNRVPAPVGETFGELTVLGKGPSIPRGNGHSYGTWICLCACGRVKALRAQNVRSGASRSCGGHKARLETYNAVHMYLKRTRGRARNYLCADYCGNFATEWSYDHLDPNERIGDDGKGKLLPFTSNLRHYQPRCNEHHRTLDARYEKASA